MRLSDKEAAFLRHFAEGRYEPELFFEDDEILERVENHPVTRWRAQGVQGLRDSQG
jgi:hypothetical protein